MKKKFLIIPLLLLGNLCFSQNKDGAKKLVDEGIAYYDKGGYQSAIKQYDQALQLDQDNLIALTEKGMTLITLEKYDEAIIVAKKAIATHPKDEGLNLIYVQYGNALDGLKKTDQSLEIYDEGIKKFPAYHQLYYNKGIALASVKKYTEAIKSLQKAIQIKPEHASSHNAIARLSQVQDKNIPSLLAYGRFFTLEPQSERAKQNLNNLQLIMNGNVEQKDDKTINITVSSKSPEDKNLKEDNFSVQDIMLAMSAALDYDEKNKNKTDAEKFIRKFETLCSSFTERGKGNKGFFWTYYAPYFIEMHSKNLTKTFGYIVFASSGDKDVTEWLKANKTEVDNFFKWSDTYKWPLM